MASGLFSRRNITGVAFCVCFLLTFFYLFEWLVVLREVVNLAGVFCFSVGAACFGFLTFKSKVGPHPSASSKANVDAKKGIEESNGSRVEPAGSSDVAFTPGKLDSGLKYLGSRRDGLLLALYYEIPSSLCANLAASESAGEENMSVSKLVPAAADSSGELEVTVAQPSAAAVSHPVNKRKLVTWRK